MLRKVSNFDLRTIYFGTAPLFLGEAFSIGGILILITKLPEIEALLGGLGFFGLGIMFLINKIKAVRVGREALENGTKTISEVVKIKNTNSTHNRRVVKDYTFEFKVDGKVYNYHFKSATHRWLQVGHKYFIYYCPYNPKIAIVPTLYSLDNKYD